MTTKELQNILIEHRPGCECSTCDMAMMELARALRAEASDNIHAHALGVSDTTCDPTELVEPSETTPEQEAAADVIRAHALGVRL